MHVPTRPTLLSLSLIAVACLAACDDAPSPLVRDDATVALLKRADPDRGRQLIVEKGCVACHVVPQVPSPVSNVGPALDNVGRQAYLSGLLPNTPANLVRWLLDPPAVNPRTAMPNVGLTRTQAEDVAAFLITLP